MLTGVLPYLSKSVSNWLEGEEALHTKGGQNTLWARFGGRNTSMLGRTPSGYGRAWSAISVAFIRLETGGFSAPVIFTKQTRLGSLDSFMRFRTPKYMSSTDVWHWAIFWSAPCFMLALDSEGQKGKNGFLATESALNRSI